MGQAEIQTVPRAPGICLREPWACLLLSPCRWEPQSQALKDLLLNAGTIFTIFPLGSFRSFKWVPSQALAFVVHEATFPGNSMQQQHIHLLSVHYLQFRFYSHVILCLYPYLDDPIISQFKVLNPISCATVSRTSEARHRALSQLHQDPSQAVHSSWRTPEMTQKNVLKPHLFDEKKQILTCFRYKKTTVDSIGECGTDMFLIQTDGNLNWIPKRTSSLPTQWFLYFGFDKSTF